MSWKVLEIFLMEGELGMHIRGLKVKAKEMKSVGESQRFNGFIQM